MNLAILSHERNLFTVDAGVKRLAEEACVEVEFRTVIKIRNVVIAFPNRRLDFKSAF